MTNDHVQSFAALAKRVPNGPLQQQIVDCNLTLRSLAHGTLTYHRSMAIDTANQQRAVLASGASRRRSVR
jgi:hypothetical protein